MIVAETAKLFRIRGRVQGVGYRNFAQREANRLRLKGYARNLADGSVEVHAQGPAAAVDELAGLLWQGPQWAEVRTVDTVEAAPVAGLAGFAIR